MPKHAPSSPGVYRMIDAARRRALCRQSQEHQEAHHRLCAADRPRHPHRAHDRGHASIEFVSTRTETEALLLEANLIKRLRPRFNVLLRDDKSFPYILITADHPAPQIMKHRGARNRPGDYYGPFASVWAVNRTITALQRAFLIRSCSDAVLKAAHGHACCTRSSAARRHAPARSRRTITPNWCARRATSSPARARR